MRQVTIAIASSGSGVFMVQAFVHPTIWWIKALLGMFLTLMLIAWLGGRQ